MAGSDDVGAVASGQASARGSACSKEQRAAELLDMVARRRDDGERDYVDGAAAVASAMVRESEGEELGGGAGVWEARGREGGRFTALAGRGRRRGGDQVRGTHAVLAAEHLACLPGRAKQLAGAAAGLGRQVGRLVGAR